MNTHQKVKQEGAAIHTIMKPKSTQSPPFSKREHIHGFLQERREVPLILLDPPILLPAGIPPELVEPDPVEHGNVGGVQLRPNAEEMVEPEEPAGPQHPVDVIQRELQHDIRDPVAENMHRMHYVERVVEEREPVADADVHRNEPPRRDEAVEGPVEVHAGRHDGHVALPHPRRERARAPADVEADADRARRFRSENLVDRVLDLSVALEPPVLLPPVQLEAVLAVEGPFLVPSMDQAGVVLARVWIPGDAGVRRDCPEAGRQWGGLDVAGGGLGVAAAAWEGLAPFEHQTLGEVVIGRALAADVVAHVSDQLVLEDAASGAESWVERIGADVGRFSQWELVRPHGELELPGELV